MTCCANRVGWPIAVVLLVACLAGCNQPQESFEDRIIRQESEKFVEKWQQAEQQPIDDVYPDPDGSEASQISNEAPRP